MEIILGFVICGFIGLWLLDPYQKGGQGCLLGGLLGPLGLIVALVERSNLKLAAERKLQAESEHRRQLEAAKSIAIRGEERECPFCAERILARAKVCRFCGRDMPPPEPWGPPKEG